MGLNDQTGPDLLYAGSASYIEHVKTQMSALGSLHAVAHAHPPTSLGLCYLWQDIKEWYDWVLSTTYRSQTAVIFLHPAQVQIHSILWSSLISPKVVEAQAEKKWKLASKSGKLFFFSPPPSPASPSRPQINSSAADSGPQNYKGYFQHCNLRNTWDTRRRIRAHNKTLSLWDGSKETRQEARVPGEARVPPSIKHLGSSRLGRTRKWACLDTVRSVQALGARQSSAEQSGNSRKLSGNLPNDTFWQKVRTAWWTF